MISFIQNLFSILEKWFEARNLSAPDLPSSTIVPGYNCLASVNKQEPLPGTYDRRQAAIFYADIVNYSGLTEQDEEGTHLRLIESLEIMKAHVIGNKGRVVHTAGDAILAEFGDADSALQCAVNVQLTARELNAWRHLDQWVLVRIGVNFGEVIVDRGDIYGNAVNLTARLERLAYSGGICISQSVRSQLEDSSSFNFIAMGKQYVKNIREPVDVFWIEIDPHLIAKSVPDGATRIPVVAS